MSPAQGQHLSESTRLRISLALKSAHATGRLFGFIKGRQPWCKGRHLSPEIREHISVGLRNTYALGKKRGGFSKGLAPWNKNSISVACSECGKVFTVPPSRYKAGKGKHCSNHCAGLARSRSVYHLARCVHPALEPSTYLSYVLGVIIGDGYVSKEGTIILNTVDYPFAESFASALKALSLRPQRIYRRIPQHGQPVFRVQAQSVIFARWYQKLEPPDVSNVARCYPREFLRGFFESEGSSSSTRVCFANTTLWKLELCRGLLANEGFRTAIYVYSRPRPYRDAGELHVKGGGRERLRALQFIQPIIKNLQ